MKFNLLSLALVATVIIFLNGVVATTDYPNNLTFITPSNNAIFGGNVSLNVTNSTAVTNFAMVKCVFGVISQGKSGNTTFYYINNSAGVEYFFNNASGVNASLPTAYVDDSNDYVIQAVCHNSTGAVAYRNVTGITIDNTVPTAPTLSPATNTKRTSSGTQTFTGTVVDRETTSCTYTIYRGGGTSDGTTGSGTYSGTSCTFNKAFSSTSDSGVWYWNMVASDESNTTQSVSNIYQVFVPSVGGSLKIAQELEQGAFKETPAGTWVRPEIEPVLWIIGIISAIVVLAIIIRRAYK